MKSLTLTSAVLLLMLVAVILVAGRVWWAIRTAERRRRPRDRRGPGTMHDQR